MPNAGIQYQHAFQSKHHNRVLGYSGFDRLYVVAGLDLYVASVALSFTAMPAVYHRLNWSGELQNTLRFEAGLYYNFSIKKKDKKE